MTHERHLGGQKSTYLASVDDGRITYALDGAADAYAIEGSDFSQFDAAQHGIR